MRSRSIRALVVCAAIFAVLFGRFDTVTAVSSNLVISQVYGGGGNAGALLRNDFIEIFNRGSAPVSLAGMSVQYASSAGTTWQVTPLTSVTLAPGQYYLVQEAVGNGGTVNLPAPDAAGTIPMSATAGKVALVNGTAALSGACPAGVVDFVGFGAANCFEGSGPTPTLSNTTAALRGANGCTETDSNAGDFSVGAPNPRNTATTPASCGTPSTNPTGTLSVDPTSGGAGDSITFTAIVTPGTNPASTGVTVTGDLSSIGGPSSQPFVQDAVDPNRFTLTTTIAAGTPAGTRNVTATIADANGRTGTAQTSVTVTGSGDAAPGFASSSPANGAANVLVNAVIGVTFTESVSASGSAFSLTCGGGAQAFTQGSSPNTTLSLTPTAPLPYSATCVVTVSATQITDADANDPPDQMSADVSFSFTTEAAPADSNSVIVISQVYGGGGNTGAIYRNDFVELYNRGDATVDVTGWSVQYAAATNSVWSGVQPLAGTIAPRQYYLVALASGGAVGQVLPAANAEGDFNMSATTGKVALVENSTPLSGCPLPAAHVEDLVGYGGANCREGTLNAAAPSNSTALFRRANGATDTDSNNADFTVAAPAPRRTAPFIEVGPSVASTNPFTDSTTAPRDATIEVSFSEPVDVVGAWFDITCAASGAHNDATFASNGDTRAITPNSNFTPGEQCTVTVFKNQVHDVDTDDSAPNTDTLSANYAWTFTVATGTEPPFPSSVHLRMGNPTGATADQGQPNNFLMEKPEFSLSYNRSRGGPNWVSWHLSNDWVGTLVRDDTFRADPAVPPDWYRVQGFDFIGSGFDRGHMVPNADRDKETARPINQATFLMSNIIAQAPDNNQGPWADMENDLRALLGGNELYIVAGGFGTGGTGSNGPAMTIANGQVTVPAYTWKAVLMLPEGGGDDASRVTCSTRTIAVIMPNVQGIRNADWRQYLTTVDNIEFQTGYDLFSNLPEPYQRCVEAGINGDNPDLVKGEQMIVFAPLADRGYDATPFTVSATGGASGNPVTFTASGACTSSGANGATITLVAVGGCTITASQAGSVIYDPAPNVTRTFTVVDAIAPVIADITVTPGVLGPPNHKMIDVTVGYTATDFSGAPVCALSVSSNEPGNGTGDGNTAIDWQVIDAHRVKLRAERAGGGTGRIYTVAIRCTDASGNASTTTGSVSVAK